MEGEKKNKDGIISPSISFLMFTIQKKLFAFNREKLFILLMEISDVQH